MKTLATSSPQQINNKRKLYKIQPNDVISIKIQSENKEVDEIFNQNTTAGNPNISEANLFLTGYNVDIEGNVLLPKIGKVSVIGVDLSRNKNL